MKDQDEEFSSAHRDEDTPPAREGAAESEGAADQNMGSTILDAIERLDAKVESRLVYDATKEKAFQHLYQELRDAKADASNEATRPLLLDLLLFYDRLSKACIDDDESLLRSFRDELLEILYRRDVHLIRTNFERFDPDFQDAVGTVETSEPNENQQIERVVRDGFKWGPRLLRAQNVVVRRMRRVSGVVGERPQTTATPNTEKEGSP